MSYAALMLTPLALLLPAAGNAPSMPQDAAKMEAEAKPAQLTPRPQSRPEPVTDNDDAITFEMIAESFRAQAQNQVRIEQQITIRITPRPAPVQPNMLNELPPRAPTTPRFVERNMGNCVPASGVAGVQVSRDNRLILYMRDQRMVGASLERSCSARDYYSGFYVQRNSDGQICVNRDTLQSRSGASCKVSRMKQLVEAGN